MQSISEILQTIARQRGRGDTTPLLAFLQLEGAAGERIAHLPLDAELAQAWVALTGEPFRPHQAHALTALRRGEPVALRAASADVGLTGFLLLYATLLAEPSATALILTPDDALVQSIWAGIAQINQDLPRPMQLNALPLGPNRRPDVTARAVITAPAGLHSRLLRHHDRGWSGFWSRLRLVLLPEIQQFTGVAAAHLADLLFRVQRVTAEHGGHGLGILALLHDVAEADTVLAGMLGQPWRVVPADDGPRAPAALAIWRGGTTWRRDVTELATTFQRQGYQVHIVCRPLERPLLAPIIGDLPRVTFGPELMPAQVLIAAGFPAGHSALRRMLRAGAQAVVLVLGELPHEQALTRQAQQFASAPNSSWVAPNANAYILARHVLCAASELPLTEAETAAWGVQDIVERLVAQGQLVDLPDPEVAWKPTDAVDDPYIEWSVRAPSGAPLLARNEQAQVLGTIEPDIYERWAFPNAALPPGAGGFRVVARNEDTGALTLRLDGSGRRTYPLRRCTVTVRDTRESRAMVGNRTLSWGRVVAAEEIYGYREATSSGAPADVALAHKLNTRWAAPACWFDLHTSIAAQGQFIGWSLAAALQMRALADFTDVVPCYDPEARRLYLIDAQPGGNGLSAWAYANAEELLPLAYDVALTCRSDPLLEPLCRVDMDWLLILLGRQAPEAPPAPRARDEAPPPRRPARQVEYVEPPIELPPPEPPPAPRREPARPAPSEPVRQPPGQRSIPLWDAIEPLDEPPTLPAPAREATPAPRPAAPAPRQREQPAAREPAPPSKPSRSSSPPPPAREPAPPSKPSRSSSPPPPAREPAPPSKPSRSNSPPPPAHEPAPPLDGPPAREDDAAPDPQALIERLRRQRLQREAQHSPPQKRPATPRPSVSLNVEQRFAAGDRVFCLPYGDGEVRDSRVEDGREVLTVAFPDLGELTIDPTINLMRKLDDTAPDDDDLL